MGLLKVTCLPHSVTQMSLGHDKVSPYEILSVIIKMSTDAASKVSD